MAEPAIGVRLLFTVWMDGMMLKVKQNGQYINDYIYLVIGLMQDSLKDVLGMSMAEAESASFWLSMLTEPKARVVKDMLIACTDNLKGFTDAIKFFFSNHHAAMHCSPNRNIVLQSSIG